jgi:ankyrin repeat protein
MTFENEETPLHIATKSNDAGEVNKLISKGADPNVQNEIGSTPLHIAASAGYNSIFKILLAEDADVNVADDDGDTALHKALKARRENIASKLIAAKTDVNISNKLGHKPLHTAADNGRPKNQKELIAAGAGIDDRDANLDTALHISSRRGYAKSSQMLIECGASLELTNKAGDTPLHLAAAEGKVDAALILIGAGADKDVANENGCVPLQLAVCKRQLDMVRALLEEGASTKLLNKNDWDFLNVLDSWSECCELLLNYGFTRATSPAPRNPSLSGKDLTNSPATGLMTLTPASYVARVSSTPLHIATTNKDSAGVKALVAGGCDINAQNETGSTALHIASSKGFNGIVKVLIAACADVNVADDDGDTALHKALKAKLETAASLLIAAKTDVNISNKLGHKPLHTAADNGRPKNQKELIAAGAGIDDRDANLDTALHISSRRGYAKSSQMLIECGASLELTNKAGDTPLHLAAAEGKAEAMNVLLEAGADMEKQSAGGSGTALQLAMKKRDLSTARALLEKGANCKVVSNHELADFAEGKALLEEYGYTPAASLQPVGAGSPSPESVNPSDVAQVDEENCRLKSALADALKEKHRLEAELKQAKQTTPGKSSEVDTLRTENQRLKKENMEAAQTGERLRQQLKHLLNKENNPPSVISASTSLSPLPFDEGMAGRIERTLSNGFGSVPASNDDLRKLVMELMEEVRNVRVDNVKIAAALEAARGMERAETEMKFLSSLDAEAESVNSATRIKPQSSGSRGARVHAQGSAMTIAGTDDGADQNMKDIAERLTLIQNEQRALRAALTKENQSKCGCAIM